MKEYPEYKDSGIEWIGTIPKHWEVTRLKWVVEEKLKYGANEYSDLNDKLLPRYIRITDFDLDGIIKNDTFRSLPIEKAKDYMLREGDVLFARSGATVGKTFLFKNYDGKACFAGYLIKASPDRRNMIPEFLYYFTKSNVYENWKNSIFIQATIQNIGADKYNNLIVTTPSILVQKSIASFLDYKTSLIDKLIQKKERQIILLKEQRTALINHAVTKGLDPNVEMKDSGIEWLGEIPKHWLLIRVKYLQKKGKDGLRIGPFGSSLKLEIMVDEGYKVYGQENVIKSDFSVGKRIIDENKFGELREYEIKGGDVVVTTMGTTGKSAIVPNNIQIGIMDSHLIRIRLRENIQPFFFSILINNSYYVENQIRIEGKGTIMAGLNSNIIKTLLLAFPSFTEQCKIMEYLSYNEQQVNIMLNTIKNQIQLLKEYRTTLITEAVTGKIDVRDWDTN